MKNDPDDARKPATNVTVSSIRGNTPNRRVPGDTARPTDALALAAWTLLAFVLTIINSVAGWYVPLPPYPSLGAHLLALVYLAVLLLSLLKAAQTAARLPQSTSFLLSVGGLLALPMLVNYALESWLKINPPFVLNVLGKNSLGIAAACLVGAAVGRIIRHPNTLLVAAGLASFFDMVVVKAGPVSLLIQSGSDIISAVSVGAGSNAPQMPFAPHRQVYPISGVTIGPADVLFMAVFQAAVHQMALSRRATLAWMFALLLTALMIVELNLLPDWLPGIPALVPMGIAVIIANARHGAFTAQEKRDLRIGAVFAIFCAVLIVVVSRALIKPQPGRPQEPRFGFALGPIGPRSSLYVSSVLAGSVAQKAGIVPGDEIVTLGGIPTRRLGDAGLQAMLTRGRREGLEVTFRHKNEMKENRTVLHLNRVNGAANAPSATPAASPSASP